LSKLHDLFDDMAHVIKMGGEEGERLPGVGSYQVNSGKVGLSFLAAEPQNDPPILS
jgi:hypothetical protein